MFEVELKAWTQSLPAVIAQTASFADYLETIDKSDCYYRLNKPDGSHISVRIRKEIIQTAQERTTVTYKKKESRTTSTGVSYEVNEEHEFTVSNADEFLLVLKDSGYVPSHSKHKIARGYQYGRFHIELCSIEGLGDFIEIETMSDTDAADVIDSLQHELELLIERCGGSRSDIERRYYSELLAEKAVNTVQ